MLASPWLAGAVTAALSPEQQREAVERAPRAPVDALAGERISQRDEHFYDPPPTKGDEWLFAPVAFDHLVLDATRPVEENVAELLPLVRRPS